MFIEPPFWAQEYGRRVVAPHAFSVLVTPPYPIEPLTLGEAKLRAGFEWDDGDPREALLLGYIAAARSEVERRTALALLTQTRRVYFDAVAGAVIVLPSRCRPLQSVTSFQYVDSGGVLHTLDPTQYVVDLAGGRLGLALAGAWPTDLRPFQPYVLEIVAGWTSVASLTAEEPLLVHLVGLLTAHFATLGRDVASLDPTTEVPEGFNDLISSYEPVVVA